MIKCFLSQQQEAFLLHELLKTLSFCLLHVDFHPTWNRLECVVGGGVQVYLYPLGYLIIPAHH